MNKDDSSLKINSSSTSSNITKIPLKFSQDDLKKQKTILKPTETKVTGIVFTSGLSKEELLRELYRLHANAVAACRTYSEEGCAFIFDDYRRLLICLQEFGDDDQDIQEMYRHHKREMESLNEFLMERRKQKYKF